jgi:hypothetical protein
MLAKARCSTSSLADLERYNQIIQLEDYINRKEGSYQFLDNTIWNMTSICTLLKICFPKGQQSSDKDTFYSDASKISPKFDLLNPTVEQDFSMSILATMNNSNHEIDIATQKLLIKTWMDKWSKPFTQSFKRYISSRDNETIKKFLTNLLSFCEAASQAKSSCESFTLTATSSNNSSYHGPSKSDDHKRPTTGSDRNDQSDNEQTTEGEKQSSKSSSQPNTTCTVCNRNDHKLHACPYWSWHPFANKEKVAFPTSTKGAEFIAQHPRKYTHLDTRDFDGKPYPNTPQFFSTQPPKGGSSGGQGKSHKGSDKGTLPDDLHIVALSSNQQSYLSSTNSIIPLTDNLVTCFISLPQERERTGRAKRVYVLIV